MDTNTINKDMHYQCKMETINRIIDSYPNLQAEKSNIITLVFNNYQKPNKYVLKKVHYENVDLYEDPSGMLLDSDLNFKGFIFDKTFYVNKDVMDKDFIDIEQFNKLMNSE